MTAKSSTSRPRWELSRRIAQFPFLEALSKRVLVCDGAMGTMLQRAGLTLEDFAGKDGCNEILCETRPKAIADVHAAYFAAGADIVETNSFGSTSLVLAEYQIADRAYELSRRSAEIARQVAEIGRASCRERV